MSKQQERTWTVDSDPFVVESHDSGELFASLLEATQILSRIGGVVMIAAVREEVAEDLFQTVRYAFRWNSYAPAKRMDKPQPVPDPDPEPVAA